MTEGPFPPDTPDGDGEPRASSAPRVNGPWPVGHRGAVIHHAHGALVRMSGGTYEVFEQVVVRRANRWSHAVLPVLGLLGGPAVLFSIYGVIVGPASTVFPVLGGIFALAAPVTYLRAALGPESYLVVVASPRVVGIRARAASDGGRIMSLPWVSTIALRRARGRGCVLRIGGPGERPLDLPLGALEANQQLWDVVYTGLWHRAAAGADVDVRTRELLALPPARP